MNNTTNQTNSKPKLNFSLWNQLETKKISREQLPTTLFKKLGEPKNELQQNLCQELIKKIVSYYFVTEQELNHTIHSVVGRVAEIVQRKWKSGPRRGQIYYDLILDGTRERLKAEPALLTPEKFQQVEKLALLGQNLVFQYRKWITNKQVLDWYSAKPNKAK